MTSTTVFKRCVEAIKRGSLVERVSATDKEYHFQNWFKARLAETGFNFEDRRAEHLSGFPHGGDNRRLRS